MCENYSFKSDLETNLRAIVKIKLEKVYGKTEMYLSDISKKPTKQTASITTEVRNTISIIYDVAIER